MDTRCHTVGPGADLTGADLTRVALTEADLYQALADESTVWPENFDPEGAGVIYK